MWSRGPAAESQPWRKDWTRPGHHCGAGLARLPGQPLLIWNSESTKRGTRTIGRPERQYGPCSLGPSKKIHRKKKGKIPQRNVSGLPGSRPHFGQVALRQSLLAGCAADGHQAGAAKKHDAAACGNATPKPQLLATKMTLPTGHEGSMLPGLLCQRHRHRTLLLSERSQPAKPTRVGEWVPTTAQVAPV